MHPMLKIRNIKNIVQNCLSSIYQFNTSISRTMSYFRWKCRCRDVSIRSCICLCWFSGECSMCLDKMFSDRKNNIVHSSMLCIEVKIANFSLFQQKKHSIYIIAMWELEGWLTRLHFWETYESQSLQSHGAS